MKRILAAFFILTLAITISFIGMKTLNKRLDTLENQTLTLIEDKKETDALYNLWKKSEFVFALTLNEEKYKNLSRHIYLTTTLKGEELLNSCNEILFEIEIIRDTQQISFENIL